MSEVTVEKSVTINRPADEVYEFIADHRNATKFRRSVHSTEHLGDGKVKTVRRHFGRRIEVEGSAKSDPQSRTLTFTGTAQTSHGPEPTSNTMTVTPSGNGASTVTARHTSEVGDPPAPVRSHIEKVIAHEIEASLEHLKHHLEAPEGFHDEMDKHFATF